MSSRLWKPETAIIAALLAASCPRMSEKSSRYSLRPDSGVGWPESSGSSPDRRSAMASGSVETPTAARPVRIRASASFSAGTSSRRIFSSRARIAMGRTPVTREMLPSSPSSPTAMTPSRACSGRSPTAARMTRAMGRSKRQPLFGRSAGARLMVIRFGGRAISMFLRAVLTRSSASRTWAVRSPTMVKWGSPSETSASIRIGTTSIPRIAAEQTELYIGILSFL